MYKKYLILIVLVLFVAGCAREITEPSKGKTFIGGTSSIEFSFMEGSPPPEVYDGGTFPFEVTLNVENKGEWDVSKDDITAQLVGFYPADFGISNPADLIKSPEEDLEGAYIDSEGIVIPGTVTYINFPELNYGGLLKGNNEFTIRAEVCYKYGTKSQADLCILKDLAETEGAICKVNERKTVESSSSPIKVENLMESVAGTGKITFSFDVVHRGTGAIYKDGSGCSDELEDKNKVKVTVNTGLDGLSCSGIDPDDYIVLYGGKRLVRCTQDLAGITSDFEKKVYIDLEFDYERHTETDILVKHTTG